MNPGAVKIADCIPTIEVIKRLGEDDLVYLNRLIQLPGDVHWP